MFEDAPLLVIFELDCVVSVEAARCGEPELDSLARLIVLYKVADGSVASAGTWGQACVQFEAGPASGRPECFVRSGQTVDQVGGLILRAR